VKADDIDISVVGETLTLTGSRQPDEYEKAPSRACGITARSVAR
jgi:HSP20 family molecular chaperone IbpA